MQGTRTILILLLCATATIAARRVRPQLNPYTPKGNRIIGGQDAEEGFAPYQISLQGQYDGHMCGGTILNSRWILTAGHCVDGFNPSYLRIMTGTNEWKNPGATYFPDEYYVHSAYDPYDPNTSNPYANDIALVHLNDTIEFDDVTQPAPLITEPLEDGDDLILTGWGATDLCGDAPDELQKITLQFMEHEECVIALGDMGDKKDIGHICTFTKKGEGSCYGDSGGPLLNVKGELSGLVNWGKPCALGAPDVHANVYYYLDWIRMVMSEQCKTCECAGSRSYFKH